MMVLDELPVTNVRLNAQAQYASPPRDANSNGSAQIGDQENITANPFAVRSMLKNSTEIGDGGEFSVKPRRVPALGTYGKPMVQFHSPSQARTPHKSYAHSYGPSHPRTSDRPSKHAYIVEPPSKHPYDSYSPRSEHYPSLSAKPSVEELRSFSMTHSSYISHNTIYRHPYSSLARLQSTASSRNVRPRSPYAYPTRLRRPGYRPSSPSLSDLNKSLASIEVDQKSYRTMSPVSMYQVRRTPTFWRNGPYQSEPSLPTPSASQRSSADKIAYAGTPSSLRSRSGRDFLSQFRTPQEASWDRFQSTTSPPIFYDYSENFDGRTQVNQTSTPCAYPTFEHGPASDQGNLQNQDESPEVSFIADLPSERNIGKTSPYTDYGLSRTRNEYQTLFNNTIPSGSVLEEPPEPNPSYTDQVPLMQEGDASPSIDLSRAETQNEESLSESHQNPDHNAQEKLSDVEEHLENESIIPESLIASCVSLTSTTSGEFPSTPGQPEDGTALASGTTTALTSPSDNSRTQALQEAHKDRWSGSQTYENTGSDEYSIRRNKALEILAPTPERSRSSLDTRKRFSKILSIDEGTHELDTIAATSEDGAGLNSSLIQPNIEEQFTTEIRTMRPDTTNEIARANVDVDEEDELSQGFMKTFCRSKTAKKKPSSSISKDDGCLSPTENSLTENLPGESLITGHATPLDVRQSHRKASIFYGLKKPNTEHFDSTLEDQANATFVNAEALPTLPENDQSTVASLRPSETPQPSPCEADTAIQAHPVAGPTTNDGSSKMVKPPNGNSSASDQSTVLRDGQLEPESYHDLYTVSIPSRPGSRPWNLDSSYPWDDISPKLDVTLPVPETQAKQPEKIPKFKLRIHRASSSVGSTGRLAKKSRQSEETGPSPLDTQIDRPSNSATFPRRTKPVSSSHPGTNNSSHDVLQSSPIQTRFVETFQQPFQTSPIVTLVPPSPGHEVRSFFSDDSSQVRPRGILRKRLSGFKTRQNRNHSAGERQGDRRLLTSAFSTSRASGRSSRQSQNTSSAFSRTSRQKRESWRILKRIRLWIFKQDDKMRAWRAKRARRGTTQGPPQQLYEGV